MNSIRIVPIDICLFAIPLMSGFASSFVAPVRDSKSSKIAFRPPSYVFGIAWFLLFMTIGYAWVRANRMNPYWNILFGSLNAMLVAWPVAYQYSEKVALGLLVVSLGLALACAQVVPFVLIPLVVWLIFAMIMSTTSIQEKSKKNMTILRY